MALAIRLSREYVIEVIFLAEAKRSDLRQKFCFESNLPVRTFVLKIKAQIL